MCEAKYDFLTVRDIQRTLKIGTNVAYNLGISGHQDWEELPDTGRGLLRMARKRRRCETMRQNLQLS